MARIRTVKPEFFDHEDLYDTEEEFGLPIRLAYIGLWTECDREGRFEWKPRRLKARIMPFDDVDFSRVLDALATRGFIRRYTVDRKEYGYVPTWHLHQVINNRERDSDLPGPDQADEGDDVSVDNETTSDACPTRAPRVPHEHAESLGNAQGEREREQGKGTGTRKGNKEQEQPCPPDGGAVAVLDTPSTAEAIQQVFAHYRTHKPKSHPKPHSKMKEWGKIRDRLKEGHDIETLCEAIDGCFASPWHQGENDRQRPFNSLELIMRDSSHISQFLELAETRGSPVMSERNQRNKRAADQFNARFEEIFGEEECNASE